MENKLSEKQFEFENLLTDAINKKNAEINEIEDEFNELKNNIAKWVNEEIKKTTDKIETNYQYFYVKEINGSSSYTATISPVKKVTSFTTIVNNLQNNSGIAPLAGFEDFIYLNKIWDDNNNEKGKRPESIIINAYTDEAKTDLYFSLELTETTCTMLEDPYGLDLYGYGGWTAEGIFFSGAPNVPELYIEEVCDNYVSSAVVTIEESEEIKNLSIPKAIFSTIIGLVLIIAGSNCVVEGATFIAEKAGLSERFIGLTIVALGTSLPELFTSVTAAMKKNSDIAVGNIVGSNIFNILFVVGLSGLIIPVPFQSAFRFDTIASGIAAILLLLFALPKKRLSRVAGIIFLICYAVYFYMIW